MYTIHLQQHNSTRLSGHSSRDCEFETFTAFAIHKCVQNGENGFMDKYLDFKECVYDTGKKWFLKVFISPLYNHYVSCTAFILFIHNLSFVFRQCKFRYLNIHLEI